ncbi:hypothetical protein DID76_02320 [Candidatus Marinamargulisbacteria bacterium SCGC AG-414-C22]|nr:hypothetical protein DID76_02320 [Candidatus Marinamargulisbacteria bacterium SCGC AG-414-C22]
MYTGQEKAQILISLLDDQSKDVLSLLNKDAAKKLSSSIDDTPKPSEQELHEILEETFEKIDEFKNNISEEDDNNLESLEESKKDLADLTLEEEQVDISSESESEPVYDKAYRSPEKIAELLQKESQQIIQFFMQKVDESLKQKISEYLPEDMREMIEATSLEQLPISDRVFDTVFNQVVIKKEGEDEDEDNNEEENTEENFELANFSL